MPPLSGSSGYGPGTSYTNTGGADFGPADYARALLMREATMPVARPAAAAPVGLRMAPMAMDEGRQGRDSGYDLQDENFKRAKQRDALLQMQARQNPAPTRLVSGPQIIPGTVMDPNAMNAYQREAYLPSGSSFQPTGITAASALTPERNPEPWDPYAGRRLEGPGVALGPGADFARRQLAAAAGRG
jgi:hypothetical protein